jgi:cellobiose-specific phosphotransferase system component IIA
MKLVFLFLCITVYIMPQNLTTDNSPKPTTYTELISRVKSVKNDKLNIRLEFVAQSSEGRDIPALFISKSEFGKDKNKLVVLVFAQQHGDEQSGKEGALLLLEKISSGELNKLFNNIDLIIVPQVNPDGSEKNQRRNGRNMDLNRNHLIMTEPEVIGLHRLFNKYLPEMTLDVHEYYPYTDDWIKFGYIKHWDEQFGTTTNPNVSAEIRSYSNNDFLPFVKQKLEQNGFTFNNYILGGPPNEFRMRHSTFDINDGRQSLGILSTFSFILEGLNGKDSYKDNIKRRAEGQSAAIEAFLEFGANNRETIKKLISSERQKLVSGHEGEKITIRMEHISSNNTLNLTLQSVSSGKDTLIKTKNYHDSYNKIIEVTKPAGYLLPKPDKRIKAFLDNHSILYTEYKPGVKDRLFKYNITSVDSIELEETVIPDPHVSKIPLKSINFKDYYFVPVNQLHGNMLVLGLEPQSMLGVSVYEQFSDWITAGNDYPVIRMETK